MPVPRSVGDLLAAPDRLGRREGWLFGGIALLGLGLHALGAPHYHFFRDEFYFLACGHHLDFGYVDQPPLGPWMARATEVVTGGSLVGMRMPMAVIGCLTALLGSLIARELGGGLFAQALAGLAVLLAPVFLGMSGYFSMNALDQLLWAAGSYVLLLRDHRDEPRLWLLFGVIAGVGLANKLTILFFGFGIAVGWLAGPLRRDFSTRWPWLALVIALLLGFPYLVWQVHHGWPTLEFYRHYTRDKLAPLSLAALGGQQAMNLGPLVVPIALLGLIHLLRGRERWLGAAALCVFAASLWTHAKAYTSSPMAIPLCSAGAVGVEQFLNGKPWLRALSLLAVVASSLTLAPFALALLPVDELARGWAVVNGNAAESERHRRGVLPQYFADQFGWEEMVDQVAAIYRQLPERDAAILANNYGEAGAIDHYGPARGLPRALSGHNNYFFWRPTPDQGAVAVTVGIDPEQLRRSYWEVTEVGRTHCRYCMPEENDAPLCIARRPKATLSESWPALRHFD
ncbi:MAG: ArnT family glycosyltransferase [Myxococcales bacterium]